MSLSERNYKLRRPASEFLCALCGTHREIRYTRKIEVKTYFQLFIFCLFYLALTIPYFGGKAFLALPCFWFCFELTLKMLFRRELPCPHCGFDPVLYCKDVGVARKKVEKFWDLKNAPDLALEENLEQNQ